MSDKVFHHYPKWIEYEGKKFIVPDHIQHGAVIGKTVARDGTIMEEEVVGVEAAPVIPYTADPIVEEVVELPSEPDLPKRKERKASFPKGD